MCIRIEFSKAAGAIGLERLLAMAEADVKMVRTTNGYLDLFQDAADLQTIIHDDLRIDLSPRLSGALSRKIRWRTEDPSQLITEINQSIGFHSLLAYMEMLAQFNPQYLADNKIGPVAQAGIRAFAQHLPPRYDFHEVWQGITEMHFSRFWEENKARDDITIPLRVQMHFMGLKEDDVSSITHIMRKLMGRNSEVVPHVQWGDGHRVLDATGVARPTDIRTIHNALKSGFGEHIDSILYVGAAGVFFGARGVLSVPALTHQTLRQS